MDSIKAIPICLQWRRRIPAGTSLSQHIAPGGFLAAAFLEDQFKLTDWLTLSGGVRLTHFNGLLSENAADPRVGAAVQIPRLHWVVRGFYGAYYQPPPLSTVSGPLLQFALDQGFGFLPLPGERDEEYQFGIAIPWRGWVLDGNHSHMHGTNVFDHDALGNSNIFLPLTISAAVVDAWEVTLRSPMMMRRAQFHLAYSSQRAAGSGNVTGGLTDFSPPEEWAVSTGSRSAAHAQCRGVCESALAKLDSRKRILWVRFP